MKAGSYGYFVGSDSGVKVRAWKHLLLTARLSDIQSAYREHIAGLRPHAAAGAVRRRGVPLLSCATVRAWMPLRYSRELRKFSIATDSMW